MNRPDPSGRQLSAHESRPTCGVLRTALISYGVAVLLFAPATFGAILQLPYI
jgi:hypothetical protein